MFYSFIPIFLLCFWTIEETRGTTCITIGIVVSIYCFWWSISVGVFCFLIIVCSSFTTLCSSTLFIKYLTGFFIKDYIGWKSALCIPTFFLFSCFSFTKWFCFTFPCITFTNSWVIIIIISYPTLIY